MAIFISRLPKVLYNLLLIHPFSHSKVMGIHQTSSQISVVSTVIKLHMTNKWCV